MVVLGPLQVVAPNEGAAVGLKEEVPELLVANFKVYLFPNVGAQVPVYEIGWVVRKSARALELDFGNGGVFGAQVLYIGHGSRVVRLDVV